MSNNIPVTPWKAVNLLLRFLVIMAETPWRELVMGELRGFSAYPKIRSQWESSCHDAQPLLLQNKPQVHLSSLDKGWASVEKYCFYKLSQHDISFLLTAFTRSASCFRIYASTWSGSAWRIIHTLRYIRTGLLGCNIEPSVSYSVFTLGMLLFILHITNPCAGS